MSEFQFSESYHLQMARYRTVDLISMAVIMASVASIAVAMIAWMSGVWA